MGRQLGSHVSKVVPAVLFQDSSTPALHMSSQPTQADLTFCGCADGKMLLTGCDDMHANMYDVHQGSLVDAFSGEAWARHISLCTLQLCPQQP